MSTQDEVSTILWTKEMGQRMKVMRQRFSWDQTITALKLGLPQSSYSKLEAGQTRVCEKFTMARFKEVFGTTTAFILFGTNPERYNESKIAQDYWKTVFLTNRRNRSKDKWRAGFKR